MVLVHVNNNKYIELFLKYESCQQEINGYHDKQENFPEYFRNVFKDIPLIVWGYSSKCLRTFTGKFEGFTADTLG